MAVAWVDIDRDFEKWKEKKKKKRQGIQVMNPILTQQVVLGTGGGSNINSEDGSVILFAK